MIVNPITNEELLTFLKGGLDEAKLREIAARLPPGFVLTHSVSTGVSAVGALSAEFSGMFVYFPHGTTAGLKSAGVSANAGIKAPIDVSRELGVAWVGKKGVSALEGYSLTGTLSGFVGMGATVPLSDDSMDYVQKLAGAARSGEMDPILEALQKSPEGSSFYYSVGLQAGAGLALSYTKENGRLLAAINPFPLGGKMPEPTKFVEKQYTNLLKYVSDTGRPAQISWSFELDGIRYEQTQDFEAVGRSWGKHGVAHVNVKTSIKNTNTDALLSQREMAEFGFKKIERMHLRDGGFVAAPFALEPKSLESSAPGKIDDPTLTSGSSEHIQDRDAEAVVEPHVMSTEQGEKVPETSGEPTPDPGLIRRRNGGATLEGTEIKETGLAQQAGSKLPREEKQPQSAVPSKPTSYDRYRQFGESGKDASLAVADYKKLFKDSYLAMNGDMEAAKMLTMERFARVWGVSDFTSDAPGTVLKNPVEKVYSDKNDDGHGYIRKDAETLLWQHGIKTDRYFISPNEKTGSDWRQGWADSDGRGPRMTLSYEDENGSLHTVTDSF